MTSDTSASAAKAIPNARRLWITRTTRLGGLAIVGLLLFWQWDRVVVAGSILVKGDPTAWAIAGTLQFACLFMGAARFFLLVRAVGHSIRLPTVYTDLVCTTALNAALIMGVGDLYRVKRTNQFVGNLALSSAIIVLDRIFGFVIVCAIAFLSMPLVGESDFRFHTGYLLVLLGLGVVGIAAARWLARRGQVAIWNDVKRPFIAVIKRPAMGAGAVAASLAVSGLWLTSIVIVARGLGIEAAIAPLVFAAAVVAVASILPVSIGGIGVRETGYALLLAAHGVDTSQAIALGVAQYALLLPIMVVGALLGFVRYRREADN